LKNDLEEKITVTVSELSQLQSKILDEELTRWKREQQLAGNGAPLTNNLDTLQSWCEDLAELIWHNRHQLKEAERLKQNIPVPAQQNTTPDRIPNLQEKVRSLSITIICNSPPSIIIPIIPRNHFLQLSLTLQILDNAAAVVAGDVDVYR
jgi:signal transducer and activator of transcription 5B